jgi:hypothetical protein
MTYEIRKISQKPQDRANINGEFYIAGPNLMTIAHFPFSYPENKHPSAPDESEAELSAKMHLEIMKTASFEMFEDCTGALTRDWAERATGVAA